MARVGKVGIQYFSHDVDMMQDKKMRLLKAKFGLIGYAVYLRLLEEIYRDKGYYAKADDDFNILFSDDINLNIDEYIMILNYCLSSNLFDKNLYEKYSILTSERIQKNYCAASERRKEIDFFKEYLLTDVAALYTKKEDVNILALNADILPLNDNILALNADIGTQSKVKESKRKKSKKTIVGSEDLWALYPLKQGKAKAIKKIPQLLEAYGLDQMTRCVDRYKAYVDKKRLVDFPDLKYKNGDTFFNGGFEDFLDDNFDINIMNTTKPKRNGNKNQKEELSPERKKAYEDMEQGFAEDLWPDMGEGDEC